MGNISLPVRVLSCGVNAIIQYLSVEQPDTLKTEDEIKAANVGKKMQIYVGGKTVRNPEYRTNRLQNEEKVCTDIAKILWKDKDFRTALTKVYKSGERDKESERSSSHDVRKMQREKNIKFQHICNIQASIESEFNSNCGGTKE